MGHDAIGRDLPFAPGKTAIVERKRGGIFILQHFCGLLLVPFVFGREDARAKHVEKSVHLGTHTCVKLTDRMMQAGREFYRHAVLSGRDERERNLRRRWKGIRRDAAGSEFKSI